MQGYPSTARAGTPVAAPTRTTPLMARQGERILPMPARHQRRRGWRSALALLLVLLALLVLVALLVVPSDLGRLALPSFDWLQVKQPEQVWDLSAPTPTPTTITLSTVGDAPPPAAPDLPAAGPDADILEIEQLLQRLSFAPGPVDGTLDSSTEDAIRQYEETAGLPVTGKPTGLLLEELRAVSASVNPGGTP